MSSKLIRCMCYLSKKNIMLYDLLVLNFFFFFASSFGMETSMLLEVLSFLFFFLLFINHQLFWPFCSSTTWHLLALNILVCNSMHMHEYN